MAAQQCSTEGRFGILSYSVSVNDERTRYFSRISTVPRLANTAYVRMATTSNVRVWHMR